MINVMILSINCFAAAAKVCIDSHLYDFYPSSSSSFSSARSPSSWQFFFSRCPDDDFIRGLTTSNKGMSAVGQALAILYKFKIISLSSSKFIFRALAESCTLYCVSVWGHGNEDEIEKMQTGFYKRLYFLPTRTPSYIVRLEFGSAHLRGNVLDRKIRLLYRLLRAQQTVYSFRYVMYYTFKSGDQSE